MKKTSDIEENTAIPVLTQTPEGLTLTDGSLSLMADFTESLPRIKQGVVQAEMLVKAAKLKGINDPVALDATAGLGEDSILLAAAGFHVHMYEYDHVIAALLRDALERASQDDRLKDIVSRMELHEENSIEAMGHLIYHPDVVLLDPMFPARNKTALIKKKFQLLQRLESPCSNEDDLLSAAMAVKPRKLLIKRPAKGPYLGGIKPDYSYEGKAVRYDCFTFAQN